MAIVLDYGGAKTEASIFNTNIFVSDMGTCRRELCFVPKYLNV
jgi:hypothetical protein